MKPKNIILSLILILLYSSCDEYLKEDYYSGSSVELQISTASGFENLISACYVPLKAWYGKEYGWDLTTVGTDCWTYAGDADQMQQLATYTSNFNNAWPGRLALIWTEFYKAINTCNTAIQYMPDAAITDELKLIREGEVRFLRAMYYWHIVETWGAVAFYNEPITSPEVEMHRSGLEVFYTQIFEDLDIAVQLLPTSVASADYGRATRYAALALRARAHLTWAAQYMSGNSYDGVTYAAINGANHYQLAIDDANEVINNGGFELYEDYNDIWLMENNNSADDNTENIWAMNYSGTEYAILNLDPNDYDYLNSNDPKPLSEREGGCHGHLMFGMRWFAVGGSNTVMLKDDGDDITATEPTRPFCRYMPTRFLIELFNEDIDQRFYGSFNNTFYANNPDTAGYPVWEATEILGNGTEETIAPELVGEPILAITDTAFHMTKETIPDDMYYVRMLGNTPWYISKTGHYYMLDLDQMYEADGSIKADETNLRRTYFDLQKWYDYTRPHNGANQDIVGSQRGKRDFIVFRLPEMYYIIAEASLGLGNQQQAYDYMEDIADIRSIDGNGAAMMQAYGVSGPGNIDIDWLLDDKAREFAGEQHRWFDLKRTGKTLERIRAHNPDAAPNIEEKHLIRPIPQIELDAIENAEEDFSEGWGIY